MTTAVALKQPTDIAGLLDLNKGAILQALPKTVKPDRFLRVCLNAISRNPDLQKCTAASLYAGIMQSAQFGLEIGLMNQAHLVPYWNSEKQCFEAQFQIGYLGLRDLGERYGDVEDGDVQAVYEKDLFDYGQGDAPFITHKPSKDQNRGQIVHYYCWAKPKDGKIKVAVMSKEEVEAHRDRFVRKKKDDTFGPAWTKTFDAMGLKTVMRRCYKFLARSPELREAISLDEMQEISIPQNLGLEVELGQKSEAREANTKQLEALQAEPKQAADKYTGEPIRQQADGHEAEGVVPPPPVNPVSVDAPAAPSSIKAFCDEQASKAAANERTVTGFISSYAPYQGQKASMKGVKPGFFDVETEQGAIAISQVRYFDPAFNAQLNQPGPLKITYASELYQNKTQYKLLKVETT